MKLSLSLIMTLLILGMPFSQPAYRQSNGVLIAPRILNYQGYLTDTSGNQFNGEATVKATIYNSGVAGQPLWSESITNVPVARGIFNVVLGNLTPIPDSVFSKAEDRWLEISVGSNTFVPRIQITAIAGAFEALSSKSASYALAGPPDNDWVLGTGALDSTLLTGNRLGISRGGVGNVLYDSYRCTHINLGVACTTGTNGGNNTYITIPGGYHNAALLNAATAAGGTNNHAGGFSSYIGGGSTNKTLENYSTIGGGLNDSIHGPFCGILTGRGNLAGHGADDSAAVVLNGLDNMAYSNFCVIGNGKGNRSHASYGTILNGRSMTIYDFWYSLFSTVINGDSSQVWGDNSIAGGLNDTVIGYYQSMLTGLMNESGWTDFGYPRGEYSVIGGGAYNDNEGNYCFIGNGIRQEIGLLNYVTEYAAIGGGSNNTMWDAQNATIGGGLGGNYYEARGFGSKIGGNLCTAGSYGATGGGYDNHATSYSAVVGGYGNATTLDGFDFAANNQSSFWGTTTTNAAAFNGQEASADGETRVGIIAKGSGAFSIDHPLDPEHKILNHYFAESPEMVLMYRGIARIGAHGRVEVRLPDYFEKLNKDPMVKLTGVGTSNVHLAEKISGNRFIISGPAGAEVHWLVTADRKDPSSEIIRILKPVEQDKGEALAGRSLDDNFLSSSLPQLERMGKTAGFNFRDPVNKKRYEESKRLLEETYEGKSDQQERRQP
jgi:hypothetical protein